MNNNLVEKINDPINDAVIGYTNHKMTNSISYFVCIKNIRTRASENFSIDKDEIEAYEKIIKASVKERADRKAQRKLEQRLREDAKIARINSGKIDKDLDLSFEEIVVDNEEGEINEV